MWGGGNKINAISPVSSQEIYFNGQNLQDLIAHVWLKEKEKGFFIDIGANDGITFSNTYFFEQYGWEGICLEPLPDVFKVLKENRKCDLLNAAVTQISKEEIEFIATSRETKKGVDDNMYSGIPAMMSAKHLKDMNKFSTKKIKVRGITFDEIMNAYPDRTHIDFLSVDVEGGELQILKTIDFTKYTFSVIAVENNYPESTVLQDYMKSVGYQILLDVGLDMIFVQY